MSDEEVVLDVSVEKMGAMIFVSEAVYDEDAAFWAETWKRLMRGPSWEDRLWQAIEDARPRNRLRRVVMAVRRDLALRIYNWPYEDPE